MTDVARPSLRAAPAKFHAGIQWQTADSEIVTTQDLETCHAGWRADRAAIRFDIAECGSCAVRPAHIGRSTIARTEIHRLSMYSGCTHRPATIGRRALPPRLPPCAGSPSAWSW